MSVVMEAELRRNMVPWEKEEAASLALSRGVGESRVIREDAGRPWSPPKASLRRKF